MNSICVKKRSGKKFRLFELKKWFMVGDMATYSARGGTLTAKPDGAKLTSLRSDRKLKQRDVEAQCDIPHGQLTRFETGKPVGIKYLLKLASFYHVKPKELLHPEGVSSTSDLLRDLAELHGAKVDFGGNGNYGTAIPQVQGEAEGLDSADAT